MNRAVETSVRRLSPADIDAMSALMTLFGDVFEEPETYHEARPSRDYHARLLASDSFAAIVAERDGAVVGGLCAYEFLKFEQERREFYIYDLAVAEHARRQGVATAMIEALKQVAADQGAYVIFVAAEHDDPPAIALYDKLGAREDAVWFDIRVPAQNSAKK